MKNNVVNNETSDETYIERQADRSSWGTSDFLILSCIQFLQMMLRKKLGENMLPYTDEKEEWQREQDSSYRNPCYTKTDQEVYELEDCKHGYVFKWY